MRGYTRGIIRNFVVFFGKKRGPDFSLLLLGSRNTGRALSYVLYNEFTESNGVRMDASHVVVIVTDGASGDNVEE